MKKVSDLRDKSREITQTKIQRKILILKRASKSYKIMSSGLIKLMTYSKPQIQEVQKTQIRIFKLLRNNDKEKTLKAARGRGKSQIKYRETKVRIEQAFIRSHTSQKTMQ